MNASGQTICLCVIVKNEAPVIRRCLASVGPLIDHWLIVDTGSTDGTQEVIRDVLVNLPGELVERPWIDFAHNRSEALALARPHGSYSLIIDADDELLIPPRFVMPQLDADSYALDFEDASVVYQRTQLVSNALPWRYAGVLHEFLTCPDARSTGHLALVMRRNHDGRRRRDPATYRNDAALLERALETEADPFLLARYTFYLAQSYRDCGEREAALAAYLRRAQLGFWDQEIFVALLQAARLMEALGRDLDETVATYGRATAACPSRAEAAHGASRLCRLNGRYEQGYNLARPALALPALSHGLFVEPWIYGYGLLDEFAVNASWTGRHCDSRDACREMLARTDLPAGDRERIAGNLRFTEERIAERWSAPDAGWQPDRPQGGTELMVQGLRSRMGADLDRVNLCVNLFEDVGLDARPLVLWMHHHVDQGAVQWLDNKARASRVDRFVFVSAWQMARYVERFNIDPDRCVVIRNATDAPALVRRWTARARPKLAYASTPYRGLSVLLDAWERLGPVDAELHIWSSHKLYGPGADDTAYERLYERARGLPSVRYHGIVPHAALGEALRDCDFLAYPNTFEETSCLAAIEAMAAGCRVICPDHGALPETVGKFGRMYPFTSDPDEHARRFAGVLAEELRNPWGGQPGLATEQQAFVAKTYDWSGRIAEWRTLLGALSSRTESTTPQIGLPAPKDRTFEVLARLRDRGFNPTGIVDAGAYHGDFSRAVRQVFGEAHILMIDALAENEPVLVQACRETGNASHVIAMLGDQDCEAIPFFVVDTIVRPDLVKTGSSKYRENANFPMEERLVPQRRLQSLVEDCGRAFQLIKLDIQGAELDALAGLGPRIAEVEAILVEMSLVAYNAGAPLVRDVLERLGTMGFVLYDVVDEHRYRDGSLLQVDGLFLRPHSRFRPQPPFWS